MASTRSENVLADWRSVAESAQLPLEAPKRTRKRASISLSVVALALLVAAVGVRVLLGGSPSPSSSVPTIPAKTAGPTIAAVATATPTEPNATPSAHPLARGTGTCTADKVTIASSQPASGYGASGST